MIILIVFAQSLCSKRTPVDSVTDQSVGPTEL